jgi:hypothetical protein
MRLSKSSFFMMVAVSVVAALTVMFAFPHGAKAGEKVVDPVQITDYSGGYWEANGSLGATRNSADTRSSIGCSLNASNSNGNWRGTCTAINDKGETRYCDFNANAGGGADMRVAVTAMTDSSWLSFSAGPEKICTWLTVSNNSYNPPPQP